MNASNGKGSHVPGLNSSGAIVRYHGPLEGRVLVVPPVRLVPLPSSSLYRFRPIRRDALPSRREEGLGEGLHPPLAKDAGRTGCNWPLAFLLGYVVAQPRLFMDTAIRGASGLYVYIVVPHEHSRRPLAAASLSFSLF
jgi:hypothetical protein